VACIWSWCPSGYATPTYSWPGITDITCLIEGTNSAWLWLMTMAQ
jgi:hypothetical protein